MITGEIVSLLAAMMWFQMHHIVIAKKTKFKEIAHCFDYRAYYHGEYYEQSMNKIY